MAVVTAKDIFRFAPCESGCCPDDDGGPGPGACDCACANCSDTAPCCFEVTISGMSNDVCGHCEDLNKTYFLKQTEENGCEWLCPYIHTLCDTDEILLTVYLDGSVYMIQVQFGRHVWRKDYGEAKPDCCTLQDEVLPHKPSAGDCDSTGATCSISARHQVLCPCIPAGLGCAPCERDFPGQWISDWLPIEWLLEVDTLPNWNCEDCDEIPPQSPFILRLETVYDHGYPYDYGHCSWRYHYPPSTYYLCKSRPYRQELASWELVTGVLGEKGGLWLILCDPARRPILSWQRMLGFVNCTSLGQSQVLSLSTYECDLCNSVVKITPL